MSGIRYFIVFLLILAGVFSCTYEEAPSPLPSIKEAPVTTSMELDGDELHIYMVIPAEGWQYTSLLEDDRTHYTLVVKDLSKKLGPFETIRPIVASQKKQYPSGFKIDLTFASIQKVFIERNELGLHIVFTALEPDMERLAMQMFGAWADPETPASKVTYSEEKGSVTTVGFDNNPMYSYGMAGGRFYLDIFNMEILKGMIKHPGIEAVKKQKGKTRIIFRKKQMLCEAEKRLDIGRECLTNSGLTGFLREKNSKTESFSFMLPGAPEMMRENADGMTAFGFKDTRLFSPVFQRYTDSDIYKVEARRKDGVLWLIFLYTGELKHRSYYSGDKFFVAFYRGDN